MVDRVDDVAQPLFIDGKTVFQIGEIGDLHIVHRLGDLGGGERLVADAGVADRDEQRIVDRQHDDHGDDE